MIWRESSMYQIEQEGATLDRVLWTLEQDDGITLAMVTDQYAQWTAYIGSEARCVFRNLDEAKAWCEVTCRLEGHA